MSSIKFRGIEIRDIRVSSEVDDGVHFGVWYFENYEDTDTGESFQAEKLGSIAVSREKARDLESNIGEVLDREEVIVDGKTEITSTERDGETITLYIEPYEFPESVELSGTWGVLTEYYEIGTVTSENIGFQHALKHNTEVEGKAFRVVYTGEKEAVCLSYGCRLGDSYVDREHGYFDLKPGSYHIWCEVE